MIQTRTFHDVVEVPVSFCEFSSNSIYERDTAAMVIGGIYDVEIIDPGTDEATAQYKVLDSVELFGCPNTEGSMLMPEPFPMPIYLTGERELMLLTW